MDETDLDVQPFERNSKWHWRILGPFPKPAGAGRERHTCCDEAGRRRETCRGFDDKDSAACDGRRRRREMCGTSQ